MSKLLEEAIVDAEALRVAATKNAENIIIDKFANEIKQTVNMILEKSDYWQDKDPQKLNEFLGAYDEDPKPIPDMSPEDQSDPNDVVPPQDSLNVPQEPGIEDEEIVIDFDAMKGLVDKEIAVLNGLDVDPNLGNAYEKRPQEELVNEDGSSMASGSVEGTPVVGVKKDEELNEVLDLDNSGSDEDPEVESDDESVVKAIMEELYKEGFGQTEFMENKGTWNVTVHDEDPNSYEAYIDNPDGRHIEVRNETQDGNGWVVVAIDEKDNHRVYFNRNGLKNKEARQMVAKLKGEPKATGDFTDVVTEELSVDYQHTPGARPVGADRTDFSVALDAINELVKEKDTTWQEEKKAAEKEMKRLNESLNKLKEEKNTLIMESKKLVQKLSDSNIRSGKLLYTNRVLRNLSLNERQREILVESIDKAKTLEEVKVIYETSGAVSGTERNQAPKQTLKEAVSRNNRTLAISDSGNKEEQEDPVYARFREIAFAGKNK